MTMTEVPTIRLNNGVDMPQLGLGVFLSKPEETAQAVEVALQSGYRLVDTAAAYLNERAVGAGIRESGVPRSEVFVTTKLWVAQYGYDDALRAFDASLDRLGLDYLDLYLLHWPLPTEFERAVAAYKAAEYLLQPGRVRAIGVCNFLPHHLADLRGRTDVVPSVNQIELNPFFTQAELRQANTALGVVTESWAPIGGTYLRKPQSAPPSATSPLSHPAVIALAEKYRKTPAQVVLRWHIEHGLVAIPKSVKADRIKANLAVFDFSLTGEEMAQIDALDTGNRSGGDPETFTSSSYAVDVENQ
jgi:diketogulonate reductase-like aldo/keto reductase